MEILFRHTINVLWPIGDQIHIPSWLKCHEQKGGMRHVEVDLGDWTLLCPVPTLLCHLLPVYVLVRTARWSVRLRNVDILECLEDPVLLVLVLELLELSLKLTSDSTSSTGVSFLALSTPVDLHFIILAGSLIVAAEASG